MFLSILTEFIGTFIFLTVILKTNDALAIGLTLAGVIYFGGKVIFTIDILYMLHKL